MPDDFKHLIFGLATFAALACACAAAWRYFGWGLRRKLASLALRPSERMSSNQLSGYLLSAHLAVWAVDDFNQLASALPARRARKLLRLRWNLNSAIECRRSVEQRLGRLGTTSPDSLAWDIQQLAYITRLGFAVGYVSREMAESTLARLQFAARARHESWTDYLCASLAAARRHGQGLDAAEWQRFEHSHRLLLEAPESPARRVGLSGRAVAHPPNPAVVMRTH